MSYGATGDLDDSTPLAPSSKKQMSQSADDDSNGCWGLDQSTRRFALFMFLVSVGCIVAFSVIAARDAADKNHAPPDYARGNCSFVRPFAMWRSNAAAAAAGCPARGTLLKCESGLDSECGAAVAPQCVFGSDASSGSARMLLVCDRATKTCGVRTYSLPVGLDKPVGGTCPVADVCGNYLGLSQQSTPWLVGTRPVACVAEQECGVDGVTCETVRHEAGSDQ